MTWGRQQSGLAVTEPPKKATRTGLSSHCSFEKKCGRPCRTESSRTPRAFFFFTFTFSSPAAALWTWVCGGAAQSIGSER